VCGNESLTLRPLKQLPTWHLNEAYYAACTSQTTLRKTSVPISRSLKWIWHAFS